MFENWPMVNVSWYIQGSEVYTFYFEGMDYVYTNFDLLCKFGYSHNIRFNFIIH